MTPAEVEPGIVRRALDAVWLTTSDTLDTVYLATSDTLSDLPIPEEVHNFVADVQSFDYYGALVVAGMFALDRAADILAGFLVLSVCTLMFPFLIIAFSPDLEYYKVMTTTFEHNVKLFVTIYNICKGILYLHIYPFALILKVIFLGRETYEPKIPEEPKGPSQDEIDRCEEVLVLTCTREWNLQIEGKKKGHFLDWPCDDPGDSDDSDDYDD